MRTTIAIWQFRALHDQGRVRPLPKRIDAVCAVADDEVVESVMDIEAGYKFAN
jgi:hypothetical protein